MYVSLVLSHVLYDEFPVFKINWRELFAYYLIEYVVVTDVLFNFKSKYLIKDATVL